MKNQNEKDSLSRRSFIGAAAAATAGIAISPLNGYSKSLNPETQSTQASSKLQVGAGTYSFRAMPSRTVQDIIRYCNDAGITSIELQGEPAEIYAGIPLGTGANAETVKRNIKGATTSRPLDFSKMEIGKSGGWGSVPGNEEQRKWRISAPMEKFEEVREMFNSAGIKIHLFKVSPASWSDEEIDYAFRAGKALGAIGLSEELDWVDGAVPRLASFAEKHGMKIAFHAHQQFGFENFSFDPYLAVSPAVTISFDAGHYYGATGRTPCEFIEKYHDRIINIHLKDKTGPTTTPGNTNQVWGQGQTPLKDILLLLQKHAGEKGWLIYPDIELEYPVPVWSNAVEEVRKCREYADAVLKDA